MRTNDLSVKETIDRNIGMLVPIVIIREQGSGQLYKGPIVSIPDTLAKRDCSSVNLQFASNELIITVKPESRVGVDLSQGGDFIMNRFEKIT